MFFFPTLTALFLLSVGVAAFWLNPKRAINQVLAAVCLAGVTFFAVQLTAKYEGANYVMTGSGSPLLWIRVKFAVVALISPTMVWLCFYVVAGRYRNKRHLILKMIPWLVLSTVLASLAFTEGFKPSDSLPGKERFGSLAPLYFGPMLAGQIAVCIASIAVARRLTGVRRLEFQFIALALGYLSVAAVAVEMAFALWPSSWLHSITRVVSYLVYIAFGISAWSVTSHRVYHSRQVFVTIGQRLLVVLPLAFIGLQSANFVYEVEKSMSAAVTILAVAMALAFALDDWMRTRFRHQTENRVNEIAGELHMIASRQSSPERLLEQFEQVLSAQTKVSVKILLRSGDRYGKDPDCVPASLIADRTTMMEGCYSLIARSRVNEPGGDELPKLLERHRWAALVMSGWESTPTLMIAIAERENRLPFTFPELRVFRMLTNVVESLYTRCGLELQSRQAQQLAAIGKIGVSIAHELRNPMWSLSSFSQLLPERINDQKFLRDFASIVPEEARRIEALAEQLLDLARPRHYTLAECDLHSVIDQTVTLLRPQFDAGMVELRVELNARCSRVIADRDAVRQVLLNLAKNAFEALQSTAAVQKTVEVSTRDRGSMFELRVDDNGPGISEAVRSTLFTSIASSGKKAGLGVGLAVCKEIVAVHRGEITVCCPAGGGTSVAVEFPRIVRKDTARALRGFSL